MNTKEISDKKKKLSLTQKQREVVVGLLLGDGHLETQNNGRTYRLKIEHGIEQKEYVYWLYDLFKDWVIGEPKLKLRNGEESSYWFNTISHGAFRFYAQQFYQNKKKRIPSVLKKILTKQSLAIWYMDDGSRKSEKHQTYNIHTLGFSHKDLKFVQDILEQKFDLPISLHKQKQKYWRIYIPKESSQRFRDIIHKYIIPSMKYKLGNKNA